jgi:hypothetical protein
VPPDIVPLRTRETVYIWLDILGKWSLVDIFVMIMMTVAFCFILPLHDGFTAIGRMVPRWPFFEFFMSTVLSLLIGHLTLWAHRLVVNPEVLPSTDPYCEAIMDHCFDGRRSFHYFRRKTHEKSRQISSSSVGNNRFSDHGDVDTGFSDGSTDGNGDSASASLVATKPGAVATSMSGRVEKGSIYDGLLDHNRQVDLEQAIALRFTALGKVLVVLLIIGTATLIYFGAYLNTFVFKFKGLIGYLLEAEATAAYGFVQIGIDFVGRSGSPDYIPIILSQYGFFMFGLVMPLGLMAALVLLWCTPLSLYRQQQLFHIAEVFNTWAALDIFCIGIVAALIQLQQFAAFIIGDSCDGINVILAEYFSEPLDGDPKCFDAIAILQPVSA